MGLYSIRKDSKNNIAMKGLDYLNNYLTNGEQDAFINNVLEHNTSESYLGTLLDANWESLLDMMLFSFYWENTPEGNDFWQDIANRQTQPTEENEYKS
jgi:hypothetical protein